MSSGERRRLSPAGDRGNRRNAVGVRDTATEMDARDGHAPVARPRITGRLTVKAFWDAIDGAGHR